LVALVATACSFGPAATPSPEPSGSPGPTIGPLPTPADHDLSTAELTYRLMDAFAPLTYCDPDEYPVSRGDEPQKAIERFPEIQADEPTFAAIVERLGFVGTTDFTANQKLAIYREWKRLNAVALTPVGDDRAAFDLLTETDPGMGEGVRSRGTIDVRGAITVESSEATFLVGCPICLSRGTLIATPSGPVAVEQLTAGDRVWTVDATGRRVAGVVAVVGRAAVPLGHQVIDLLLDDGRRVLASPGHPLADGRRVGEAGAGDLVDGARVVSAVVLDYDQPFTYDLLPSGDTGLYWANGILLGSTLDR
jgi:hypothetical protein